MCTIGSSEAQALTYDISVTVWRRRPGTVTTKARRGRLVVNRSRLLDIGEYRARGSAGPAKSCESMMSDPRSRAVVRAAVAYSVLLWALPTLALNGFVGPVPWIRVLQEFLF